jgi:hypothetical protein
LTCAQLTCRNLQKAFKKPAASQRTGLLRTKTEVDYLKTSENCTLWKPKFNKRPRTKKYHINMSSSGREKLVRANNVDGTYSRVERDHRHDQHYSRLIERVAKKLQHKVKGKGPKGVTRTRESFKGSKSLQVFFLIFFFFNHSN